MTDAKNSDAANDEPEGNGKLKRKEYEQELARLHRDQNDGEAHETEHSYNAPGKSGDKVPFHDPSTEWPWR
jgi:hypothetical protein